MGYLCTLLANSLEYPQRIEWSQSLNRLSVCLIVCSLSACLSANFLIFPSFILLFLYSTVQKSAVQYSYSFIKVIAVCNIFTTRRLMSIYKVYSIGRTWSWPVMSAPACYIIFLVVQQNPMSPPP